MKYTLMHKWLSVADVETDENTGYISDVIEVFNPQHIPVGVLSDGHTADRMELNQWWRGRTIPASRSGIRQILDELDIYSPELLARKCFGLSLSDQYWLSPDNQKYSWDKINFFDNNFSEDVGKILFNGEAASFDADLVSPDNTSDGWLRKKWTIINGKRCLLKAGSGIARQEPYNEVLASAVMRRLGIAHAEYTIGCHGDEPYSVCENFITPQTELIPAHGIMNVIKKEKNVSSYQHFLDCCDELEIPGVPDFIDKMLTVDYLIVNEDRHFNNFGAVRNAETLEYVGMAPVFDSGSSMWFSSPNKMIRPLTHKLPSKPFKNTHEEQIKLVRSFDWLDIAALRGIDEEFNEILRESVYIEDVRRDSLCYALGKRVELLKKSL